MKTHRINGEDVAVKASKVYYTGITGIDNAGDALDNINTRLANVEQSGGGSTSKSLKVLAIANSFCENLFQPMSGLFSNLGITNVSCYNLFRGGMTPASWYDYYNRDDASFQVEYWAGPHISAVDNLSGAAKTVSAALGAAEWDVVILQQFHSSQSPTPNYSAIVAYLAHLVAHIRNECPNRNVKIGMNMEWPRSLNSNKPGPKGITGYLANIAEIKSALEYGNIDFIIPSATAVMNAAYNSTLNTLMASGTSYSSDKTKEEDGDASTPPDGEINQLLLSQTVSSNEPDRLHLAAGVGKYVIAGCFIESVIRPLIGKTIVDSTYTLSADANDSGSIAVTASNRALCHAAVMYAMANPFARSELNAKNF